MPRIGSNFLPKYRRHKASGQAVVTIGGHDFYLGPWQSKASKMNCDRLVGEWLAAGRPARWSRPEAGNPITIVELLAQFWRHCQQHYKGSQELDNIRIALRPLQQLYGSTPAQEFGPLALKGVRQRWINLGHSRGYINLNVGRIRRLFKWAVSEELIAVEVYQALATVQGLQRGRSAAKETEPIQPVPDTVVEATLIHLPKVVGDMLRLQRLTGARPEEICILRPADIDRSGIVWAYRPSTHKNKYRGRDRVIFLGPRAQAILLPYLLRDSATYCFSPSESEAIRKTEMRENRKTPIQPSQRCRCKKRRKLLLGNCYDVRAYRRAIHRAADAADVQARKEANDGREADGPRDSDEVRLVPRWSPNRLRHTLATEIRKAYGLEAASTVLGHARADVTQLYAARDLAKAAMIMGEVG